MGIARCICYTNAKLAIRNRRESNTAVRSVKLSLFCIYASAILCFAKSDMIAIAIVILKPCGFSDILFAIKLA